MFIVPADLDEETATATQERVRGFITTRGGEIHTMEPWGRRRLAYPIKRFPTGIYHIARVSLDTTQVLDLERALRLNEQVLRHMIIRRD